MDLCKRFQCVNNIDFVDFDVPAISLEILLMSNISTFPFKIKIYEVTVQNISFILSMGGKNLNLTLEKSWILC